MYLSLDAEIEQFWESNIAGVKYIETKLNEFETIVKALRAFLENEAKRANAVLMETEQSQK